MLFVGYLVRPKQQGVGNENTPYECGEQPVGSAFAQFNIRFYVIAIIFIIFDVEVVALFPTLVHFKKAVESGDATFLFIKLFIFIGLLLAGLLYCWVRGDLEWVKGFTRKPILKPRVEH